MGKGYAEGPAAEAAEEERERRARGEHRAAAAPRARLAVYGCTAERPEQHFLGWRDELDPDALFARGEAWGLAVRRQRG